MDDKTTTSPKKQPAPTPADQSVGTEQLDQTSVAAAAKQTKKGLSKKALWGIVGGSIALVLIIVGVILAVVFLSGPSKEDYQEALKAINDIDSSKLSSKLYNTDGDYPQKVNEVIKEVDSAHDKIGSMKALRDAEVKTAYDAYIGKWNSLKPDLEATGKLVQMAKTYREKCRSANRLNFSNFVTSDDVGKKFDDTMSDCLEAVDELSKSDNEDVSEFGNAMRDYYKKFKEYVVGVTMRYKNKDFSGPRPEYPSLPDKTNPLLEAGKKLREGANEISSAYRDFADILKRKANEA